MLNQIRSELQSLFKGILRDYQIETIFSFFEYYFSGNDGNIAAALPTGTGKTPIISGFVCYSLYKWPFQRFLVMSHVKELLVQNFDTLNRMWNNAPAGIYSAGLNQRDTAMPIIFAGIASIINNIEAIGFRDIVIVDECHLISPKEGSMYQVVLKQLKLINPNLKVIGLTASPYRLGQGLITEGEGAIIDDICINLTAMAPFNRFFAEGYLSPVIPKRTNVEIDVSDVKIMNGDYAKNQLDEATEKILYAALKELFLQSQDRNCWLIFCSGIKPSEHAAEILQSFGVSAAAIHSKLKPAERDARMNAFKTGELRAIVGNNIFTTGFDHPPVDLIGMLRSTVSPGLWIQMIGRGTRPYDFTNPQQYIKGFEYIKKDCLVLDFAGNCRRLGPINDVVLPRKKGEKTGEAPIKICNAIIDKEVCGIYNHASARVCCSCGTEFLFQVKLKATAGTDVLIAGTEVEEIIEEFPVTRVIYHKHNKIGSNPSLKVSYYCGLQRYSEYVCLEHLGMAKTRAKNWWRQRHASEPPETVDEALFYSSQLRCPKRISVVTSSKYPEITSVEW